MLRGVCNGLWDLCVMGAVDYPDVEIRCRGVDVNFPY